MIIGESARFCVEEYKLSPKMMILPDSLGIARPEMVGAT